jgi:transglutaminase-like putative cysteine protease
MSRPGKVTATPTVWRDFKPTAANMVKIILESKRDPELRASAIEIIKPATSGFYVNEARLLFNFLRDQVKYIGDPTDEDVFQWPLLTLRNRAADCNNRVILLGALASSIGFPVQLVFAWDTDNPDLERDYPSHVWLRLDVTKAEEPEPIWIPLETTPTRDPVAMATNVYVEFGDEFPIHGHKELVAVKE